MTVLSNAFSKQTQTWSRHISSRPRLLVCRSAKRSTDLITLETADPAQAVRRAESMRDHIDIESGAPIKAEIDRFIAYKLRQQEYTRSSALTKRSKLLLLPTPCRWASPPASLQQGRFSVSMTKRSNAPPTRPPSGKSWRSVRSSAGLSRPLESPVAIL